MKKWVSQFIGMVKQLSPGSTANVGILREGMSKEIPVVVGSVEAAITQDELLAPLRAPQVDDMLASEPGPVSLEESIPSSQTSETPGAQQPSGPTLELDTLVVEPEQVTPRDTFEVVVDFRVSDPEVSEDEVTLIMNYSITQAGKVLKRFETKEFAVANQDFYSITRRPKAANPPGTYTVEVELTYQGLKATSQALFSVSP